MFHVLNIDKFIYMPVLTFVAAYLLHLIKNSRNGVEIDLYKVFLLSIFSCILSLVILSIMRSFQSDNSLL